MQTSRARIELNRRQNINNRDPRGYDRGRDLGPRVNERIRVREILVIDEMGNKLGAMSPRDAVDIARSRGYDLVEVAPNAQPPVCRIVDYGKYKYEQGKKDREAAKKQRQAAEIKGMTLRPGTDDHDLDFKIKNIVKFLGDGEKVKVTVRFRSREMSHPEFAQASLNKIVAAAIDSGVGAVERPATMEGKQMILVLSPTRDATKKPTPNTGPKTPKEKPARPAAALTGAEAVAGETTAPDEVDEADEVETDTAEETDGSIAVSTETDADKAVEEAIAAALADAAA